MTTTEAALRDALKMWRNVYRGSTIHNEEKTANRICDDLERILSQPSPASSTAGEVIVARDALFQIDNLCENEIRQDPGLVKALVKAALKETAPISGEPASVAGEAEKIEAIIKAQMREWWDEICQDTGCHPLDIERQGKILFYEERHWTEAVAKYAARDILALSKPTPVEAKPWYETDAHRDLSRIIPDMEGKIAEAKTRYAHCLPDHLFAPLEASITELRVLRHEVAAQPTPVDDRGINTKPVVDRETGFGVTQTQALGQEFEAEEWDNAVERLGEELFAMSDSLRRSHWIEWPENHAMYEKVVAAFQALPSAPSGEIEK